MSSYILSALSPRSFVATRRRTSVVEAISQLFASTREVSQARRVARELLAMSDRQLRDIGIRRDEIFSMGQGAKR